MYKDKLIVLNTIHISHLIFLITMRITIWKTNHIHGIKRNPMFYSDNCQKHPAVLSVQLCSRSVKTEWYSHKADKGNGRFSLDS